MKELHTGMKSELFKASEGLIIFHFRNHEVLQEKTQHVSRFIALAKVGNPKKLKWLYAFNINPLIKMPAIKLNEQPASTTPCPYACVVQEQNTADQRKVAN